MPIITSLKNRVSDRHNNKEETCWIDVDLSKPEDSDWLTSDSGLSDDLVAFLLRENFVNHRNLHDGSVLIALKVSGDKPTINPIGLVDLKIFIDANRIITIRYHPVMAIDKTYAYLDNLQSESLTGENAESKKSAHKADQQGAKVMDVFCQIVTNLIVHIEKVTFAISDQIAVLEDQYFDRGQTFDARLLLKLRGEICKTRRILAVLHNTLSIRIIDPTLLFDGEDKGALVRVSRHVDLHLENLDDLLTRIDMLQSLDDSKLSEAMSQSSFNLTIVATVFLPLTFVSGLLGMNVGGIPDTHNPWGFWGITAAMLCLAVGLWVYLYRHLQSIRLKR
ncbi:CorA family divalent cation transporter [Vibrio renipiscarius]|uniref:Magnesium transporter CorA n=1 Tax=Vibrio renipiscarius TaxID=1461322 RepID=A0A0C2N7V6_9VIBR|nr:CorA family divalent cation transporter [Vibrio renipiscarius]KII75701.1 magnesium transporter CorA [Vibrio renipiscarius]KII81849.1 magnesium transporter CorA [Vibrio renipiscarius]